MKKIKFIFGTHNTQAAGSPGESFEKAYRNAYKPFLSVLYNFPDIPAVLHFSGTLLQWLEEHHSEFLDVLGEMVNRKQVELLGGGFYEPVLPLVPNSDRIGQIESLTTFLRKRFGKRPRGTWVTERVWEPSLASSLKNSGMDYTFLDDYHFSVAGVEGDGIYYPCQTEDQGKSVVVFPVSYPLRSMIPSESPEDFIEKLRELASEDEERVAVCLEDGEKLGDRDDSHGICYDGKWLERFFTLLRANADWIEMVLPGRYLRQITPRRKVYFPCTSYEEMMSWALPPRRQRELLDIGHSVQTKNGSRYLPSGGYFRQFLTKYPESNLLYAKMMYTHILVNQIRGDKYRKKAAREELWRGQCNAAYWHGRSGGLYSNRLRKEMYKSLIEAEKVTREKGVFIPSIISVDFDMDGEKEYLYQGHELNAYIHGRGAVLFELDYLPSSWNYLDTLSRYPEIRHERNGTGGVYDRYMRKAFMDHIFSQDVSIEAFDRMNFSEQGDFMDAPYEFVEMNRDRHEIQFTRKGNVSIAGVVQPLEIRKRYEFKGKSISVQYVVCNPSHTALSFVFASEINLSQTGKGPDAMDLYLENSQGYQHADQERADSTGVGRVLLQDHSNGVDIDLSFDSPCDFWSLPVETVSGGCDGLSPDYQSTCLMPRWNVTLPPGRFWETTMILSFSGKKS